MKLDYRLGDFTFRGRMPPYGREGPYITESEGWKDSVDMRRTRRPRPQAIGDFPEKGYGASRVVSWSGKWYEATDKLLDRAGNKFLALLADGGYERLFVDEPTGTLWGDAGLISSTFKPQPAGYPVANYSMSLLLPDPRKYGKLHRFPRLTQATHGQSVASFHWGNTTAWPQFEITGVAPGYRINGPGGRAYIVTRPLVDMKNGQLYVNGVQVLGGVLRPGRWGIEKGQTVNATVVVTSGYVSVRQLVKDTNL
jgi:hypothetical protein